ALQHWALPRYRAWKRDLAGHALAQAEVEAPVDDLVDAHGEGRRRVVLHARRGAHDELGVGFAARSARHIISIARCPGLPPWSPRRYPRRVGHCRSSGVRTKTARYPVHHNGGWP